MLAESQPALLDKPFNRSLAPGRIDKLDITRLSGLPGVAEMSVQKTDWEGEDAYLLLLRDETVNKRHQERIERLNSLLRAIRNVNQVIVRERDRILLAQRVCDELVKTRGYYRASIVLVDQTGTRSATTESCIGDAFKGDGRIPEIPQCVKSALAVPGVVCIEDTSATCGECALAAQRAYQAALAIRLEYRGRVLGTLGVALPSQFVTDQEEHALFVEIAEDIAFALHNLEMEEKRQQAEHAQKEAEARYEALFSRSLELVYIHDFTGQFLDANDRALAALGYQREEIPNIRFEDLMDLADLPRAMFAARKIYQDGVDTDVHTFRLRRKDGSHVWIETTGVRLDSGGEPSGIIEIARDITQRKTNEQELLVKQAALQSSMNAVALADFDGKLTYVNPAFLKYWGMPPGTQVVGRSILEFWKAKTKAAEVLEALSERGRWAGELVAMRPDGSVFEVELFASTVWDEDSRPLCIMVSFTDITQRKKLEQ
jgi:PAS domain S-box-containing protein